MSKTLKNFVTGNLWKNIVVIASVVFCLCSEFFWNDFFSLGFDKSGIWYYFNPGYLAIILCLFTLFFYFNREQLIYYIVIVVDILLFIIYAVLYLFTNIDGLIPFTMSGVAETVTIIFITYRVQEILSNSDAEGFTGKSISPDRKSAENYAKFMPLSMVAVLVAVWLISTFILLPRKDLSVAAAMMNSMLYAATAVIGFSPLFMIVDVRAVYINAARRIKSIGVNIIEEEKFHALGSINVACFDKTGIATKNELYIESTYFELDEKECYGYIYALENNLDNHVARLLTTEAEKHGYKAMTANDIVYNEGSGVDGHIDGKSIKIAKWSAFKNLNQSAELYNNANNMLRKNCRVIGICVDNTIVGLIAINDTIIDISKEIKALKELNLLTMMLTGDNAHSMSSVANSSNVEQYRSGLTPEAKCAVIDNLRNEKKRIMVVTDGSDSDIYLNKADVSVIIDHGKNRNKADIIIEDKLSYLPLLIIMSRKCARRTHLCVSFGVILSLLIAALSLIGSLSPVIAAGIFLLFSAIGTIIITEYKI